MNKSEVIAAVAEKTGLEKTKVEKCVNAFIETVQESVSSGEPVQFVGFGTFERRRREARTGRNPQTGEELQIPASNVPAFKAGKLFKDLVNAIHGN